MGVAARALFPLLGAVLCNSKRSNPPFGFGDLDFGGAGGGGGFGGGGGGFGGGGGGFGGGMGGGGGPGMDFVDFGEPLIVNGDVPGGNPPTMPDFNMGDAKETNQLKPGGNAGLFPGIDMGGMMDMMNGMMADAMNCMEKEFEVACEDAEFRKAVFAPLWYCRVAIGDVDPGPVPPCDGPIKFGDASKCKKDQEKIREELGMAKSTCFKQLEKLYDLQEELGKCAASISEEKKKVDAERQELQDVQHQAEECEKEKAKAKSEKSLGTFSSEGSQFCPDHTAELKAAFAKYTLAVEQCISVQVSAAVQIPEINIEVPEITVGEVQGTSFSMKRPDFNAADFAGDIVVPGGGGKLNVAGQGGPGPQGQGEAEAKAKLTFDQRMSKVKADIKACEEARPKVAETQKELAATKSTVTEQKQQACKEPSSLLQTSASPEAQVAIQVFGMMKMTWGGCSAVAAALDGEDGLLKVLEKC